jgi:murein DD-endopeptidase MepM/ murein hydrolase activator NlpD
MQDIPRKLEDLFKALGCFWRRNLKKKLNRLFENSSLFSYELTIFVIKKFHLSFLHFEAGKEFFVTTLYRQRGKYAKRLMHSGMAGLAGLSIVLAPIVAQEFPGRSIDPWTLPATAAVLSSSTQNTEISTTIYSDKVRGDIIDYQVQKGDTVSSIAEKFGISVDTIRWQNNLQSQDAIKEGQTLQILPLTGVSHTVKKGDTVYSIAKRYDVDPQVVVDYPFNTFTNDETFELAIGQIIIVPDGVKPAEVLWSPIARVKQITPNAGTVVASGTFVWPAGGTITQHFVWYHKAIDIANRAAPDILAADSGTVIVAGWPDNSGYGNRVVIDHGNGYRTLYGHLSKIYVVAGQTVARGNAIGKMGTTGHSTGVHLHFEVIKLGTYLNPLGVLQ